MFKEILELENPQQKISKHNLGSNIGISSAIGIHTKVFTKFMIEAAIESSGDIISKYRDRNDFTSQTNSFKIAFCYPL